MPAQDFETGRSAWSADAELWRRARDGEGLDPNDDPERFLDLAGLADGRLDDEDDRARLAALLAREPELADDLAAAAALPGHAVPAASAAVIVRAQGLVAEAAAERGRVIAFPLWRRRQLGLRGAARWAGAAAAMVVAGWLGFALGSDTSLAFGRMQSNDDAFLGELLNPATGILRDLTEGAQT